MNGPKGLSVVDVIERCGLCSECVVFFRSVDDGGMG